MHNRETGSGQQACHVQSVWLLHAHVSSTQYAKQNLQTYICTTQNLVQVSYSGRYVMPGLYGCCMHTGLAHHVLCKTCLPWGGTPSPRVNI